MQSLQTLGSIIARLKTAGETGLGVYLVDQELENKFPYKGISQIYSKLGGSAHN